MEDLRSQSPRVGGVVFIKRPGFYVYYLVTKELFFHKPRLYDYVTALHALRDLIVCHRITELSIPQLGCGLDRVPTAPPPDRWGGPRSQRSRRDQHERSPAPP